MSRRILSYWSLIDDTHPHHHNHIMAGWREGHPAFRRTEAESGHCKSHGLENLFFFLLVEALCVMVHYQIFAALHQPNFSLRLTLQWHSIRFKNATNKQTIAATQCNNYHLSERIHVPRRPWLFRQELFMLGKSSEKSFIRWAHYWSIRCEVVS